MDIIQILFRDWIQNTIDYIGHCKATTDIFQPTLRNFFYKRWPIIFFYGKGCFFVRCCRKYLQCRSARFFRSSSIEVVFRPAVACFHLIGKENISQPRQKHIQDSLILNGKNASRRRPGKMTDRGLKKKHHWITRIKHFQIDIIQILFRDWIQSTIDDIGRCKRTTYIFQPTLRNFFDKRWPIIFFIVEDAFLFGVAVYIYNVCRLGFFVRAQPKLCFGRHRHVFICLARKKLFNLGKNTWWIHWYWSEKI